MSAGAVVHGPEHQVVDDRRPAVTNYERATLIVTSNEPNYERATLIVTSNEPLSGTAMLTS